MSDVMRLWVVRSVLVAFGAVLMAIVIIADRGEGGRYWGFLSGIPNGDKLGHVGLVGTLTLLLNLSLGGRKAPGRFRFALLGSVLVLVVMSIDEISQAYLPHRSCDGFDWLANLAGIAAADVAARWLGRGKMPTYPRKYT